MRAMKRSLLLSLFLMVPLFGHAQTTTSESAVRTFHGSLGILPGLINPDGTGPFVDLVRVIDDLYPDVEIIFKIYPMERAKALIGAGEVDFALPATRNQKLIDILPCRFSSESFGQLARVIYSHVDRPINADMLYGKVPTEKDLLVEGTPDYAPFPIRRSLSLEQSLGKVSRGRIDALIWAQEETDGMLRHLGYTNIHRELFGYFDDVFLVRKGSSGDEMDAFLTEAINKLRASGQLEVIYSKIHKAYDPWQPAATN